MLKVIVLPIPALEFPFEFRERSERVSVIQGLLITAVASLDRAVLRGLAWIDEEVCDALARAEAVERVQGLHGHTASSVGTEVSVGESRMVVGLHAGDGVREASNDFLQEVDGTRGRFFGVHREVSPPGGTVDGGVLEIPPACDVSRYVLHVDLDELPGFS